ncbi:hypothetical protein MPSEU_000191100 [Mayamaea pseudoterrestris]|nr:hypothetical protein MPSEU_000191100 [Mayamaea pseudoterrestris]
MAIYGLLLWFTLYNAKVSCAFITSHRAPLEVKPHVPVHAVTPPSSALEDVRGRREFVSWISGAAACLLMPLQSRAAEDLVNEASTTLYNPDGSLKQDISAEAKFKAVQFDWNPSNDYLVNIDGQNAPGTSNGTQLRLSYKIPEKWTKSADSNYYDPSENAKACDRIIIYQAPDNITMDRLEKASTIGIAKALDVTQDLQSLYSSDLVSGRTTKRDGQTYFEFDCAVAPKTCADSKEDLGLGFCPYETIYLLSATQVRDKLYVMAIESNKLEWKRANSDLKRVRSTFRVEAVAS